MGILLKFIWRLKLMPAKKEKKRTQTKRRKKKHCTVSPTIFYTKNNFISKANIFFQNLRPQRLGSKKKSD